MDSEFLRHEGCPKCGSSDALSRYSDGHAYCFRCNHYEKADGSSSTVTTGDHQTTTGFLRGITMELTKRALSKAVCDFWNYTVADHRGQPVQVASHYDDYGNIVAQKLRFPNKDFSWIGNAKDAGLYGKWLWKGCSNKRVIITEGEIDALSVSHAFGNREPVVSLPSGAQGAARAIKKDYEWLCGFEQIVLMFDMDEPGREAVKEVAALLPPGKALVCELSEKDANDMIVNGKAKDLVVAIGSAKVWRPDGIVNAVDLRSRILKRKEESKIFYPWGKLNKILKGIREGELITITAGIGTGKTTLVTEIAHCLLGQDQKIGLMMMEENLETTALRLVGHTIDKPLHISQDGVNEEDIASAFDKTIKADQVFLYDHMGEASVETFINKVTYFSQILGCKYLFVDNLSVIVAGLDERDERRSLDKLMKELWSCANRNKMTIFLVSHMKRIDGNKGHEDGVATSLSHLRGSNSIGSNSNAVIAMERDQQGEEKNVSTVRVLKNRYTGETGLACRLKYSAETGRLVEMEDVPAGMSPISEKNDDF